MANKKTTTITNAETNGGSINAAHLVRGQLYAAGGVIAKAADDTDTNVFRYFRVKSSDRITSLRISNAALTGATDVDLGFYQIASAGGAVVSKDKLADGLSLASARANPTEVLGTGTNGVAVADQAKRVWEWLGLTADPGIEYDVALTFNTGGTAAGAIGVFADIASGN